LATLAVLEGNMNEMLQDISPAALVAAIEDNLFAQILLCRKWPQAEVYDGDDIKWDFTCVPLPMFNNVFCARLTAQQVGPMIQSVMARAETRRVPVLWWTGPQTQPVDLGRHLEAHGFTHEGHVPGMAIDLITLKENGAITPGFGIQQVGDPETLKTWCQVCINDFGMPSFVGDAYFEFLSHISSQVDSNTVLLYLGWLNSQPVATSMALLAAGVAGIYGVTTIPEARCRGIGTRMTLAPLYEARAMGYRVGILQASGMGVSVYRRLGFQEYCQLGQYVWSPTPAHEGTAHTVHERKKSK
jgi:hypothetical protein